MNNVIFQILAIQFCEIHHHVIGIEGDDDCAVRVDSGEYRGRTNDDCVEYDSVSWQKSLPCGFEESRTESHFVFVGN
jgi:hypothetical protein